MITTHLTIDLEQFLDLPKVLLYFSTPTCSPCKTFGPIVESFSEKHLDIQVVKIDADAKRDLASLYAVRSVPTVISLEHGAERSRHTGLTDITAIEKMFGV